MGDHCIQRTSNNRVFTKHTFIAAITSTGLLGWELYDEGASNTQRFVAFLTEMIRRHRLRGYLFLMDNAGAHRNVAVCDLIASSGNTILYTVPYNPQTNAIENWFSQFKHYMATSKVRTVPGIRDDILVAITHIMPEHYRALRVRLQTRAISRQAESSIIDSSAPSQSVQTRTTLPPRGVEGCDSSPSSTRRSRKRFVTG